MKKQILYTIVAVFAVFTSCEKEGEKLTVSGLNDPLVTASGESVVLTPAMRKVPVLALTWTESELEVSNPVYGITDEFPYVRIELSASEDFETYQSIQPTSTVHGFTGGRLNSICRQLGFEPDQEQTLYIRVNTSYGRNTAPVYGNVLTFDVTTYYVDLYRASILNSDREDTGNQLYSPDADGVFYGFTGVSGWYNWYLLDGDYELWGNDGVAGTPFLLSSDEGTLWNMWYPEPAGCYFTTVNTDKSEWSAISIPSLSVTGSVTGEMTFNQSEVKWVFSVTTEEDNATITVSTDAASLYNLSTGDGVGEATEIAFIPTEDGSLTFEESVDAASNFTFGTAGDYTLTLYLSDYSHLHYEITDGLIETEPTVNEFLYLPGIDDLTSGGWNFNNYLRLISEADLTYAGVVDANSEWGYQMAIEKDNWSDIYTMGETEGTLAFQGESNIPAPETGLNLIQADLNNLTYSHMVVSGLSYSGFNDDWTMVSMTETAKTGTYAASVTINGASEWGGQLYLNGDWDYSFGGTDGTLYYSGAGIADDAVIDAGSYDLIANVIDQSYVFLGNEVYIAGLNDVWDFESVVLTKQSTGVYSGTAIVTNGAPWGIAIHIDQSWNRYFGGSLDSISYLGDNIDMSTLANGTYDITVDFINNTCSFQAQ